MGNSSSTPAEPTPPAAETPRETGLLEVKWRSGQSWDKSEVKSLKKNITTQGPVNRSGVRVEYFRVLLVGQVGAGKSSFVNSVNSIFRGRIAGGAVVGFGNEKSLTKAFRVHEVRQKSSDRNPLPWRICNTRGLRVGHGPEAHELMYLVNGHVPDGTQLGETFITPDDDRFQNNPSLGDKAHCVAFVIDATLVDYMEDEIWDKLRRTQTLLNKKAVPVFVLLTKIDMCCQHVRKDVKKVFDSQKVHDIVKVVSRQLAGIPENRILPIKNYEKETELEGPKSILILKALHHMLNLAQDYLDHMVDSCGGGRLAMLDKGVYVATGKDEPAREIEGASPETEKSVKREIETGAEKAQALGRREEEERQETEEDLRILQVGVHVTFPSNIVTEIKCIKCKTLDDCRPPTAETEVLVGDVVELSPPDLAFSESVTLALSYSATRLRDYEVVVQQLKDKESNTWEELNTVDTREENDPDSSTDQQEVAASLPNVKATIRHTGTFAAVCRLASRCFEVTAKGVVFVHPKFCNLKVDIPVGGVAERVQFKVAMKVQEIPAEDIKNSEVHVCPVLHLHTSKEVDFLKPVIISIPVDIRDKESHQSTPCQIRVFNSKSGGRHEHWEDIIEQLDGARPILENNVVKFQVNHFSLFCVVLSWITDSVLPTMNKVAEVVGLKPKFEATFRACVREGNLVEQFSSFTHITLDLFCLSADQKEKNKEGYRRLNQADSKIDLRPEDKCFVKLDDDGDLKPDQNMEDFHLIFKPTSSFQYPLDVRAKIEDKEGLQSLKTRLYFFGSSSEKLCDFSVTLLKRNLQQLPTASEPSDVVLSSSQAGASQTSLEAPQVVLPIHQASASQANSSAQPAQSSKHVLLSGQTRGWSEESGLSQVTTETAKQFANIDKAFETSDVVLSSSQAGASQTSLEASQVVLPQHQASASQANSSAQPAQSNSKHVLLLGQTWGWSEERGLSQVTTEIAKHFATIDKVRATFLVIESARDQQDQARKFAINLVRAPYKDLSCLPDDVRDVDVVVSCGKAIGPPARAVKNWCKCSWTHISCSSSEENVDEETNLCESSNVAVGLGSNVAEACTRKLRLIQKEVSEFIPGIFEELQVCTQGPNEGTTFSVLAFYPPLDEASASKKIYEIPAKAVGLLPDGRYKFRLFALCSPHSEPEELKEILYKQGITPRQLIVRSHCPNIESCRRLLTEVDLLILPFLPSRSEDFGLVALQAISAGLPVLVSSTTGLGDALREVTNGGAFIVNSDDPEEWKKRILAVKEKERSLRLTEANLLRENYNKEYSWEEQCKDLWERILSEAFTVPPSQFR